MIPYEDLCSALDIYNRKLRGEDVPVEAYEEQALDDDYDIVESDDAGAGIVAAEGEYYDANPDVTAETAVPEVGFGEYDQSGSGEQAQAAYDSGAVPGQPAEDMTSDQYSSGQQQQEGYEQPAALPPDSVIPDDQDPNSQQ